ncbi:RHS repeat-associated core domain-containing protein [Halovulum sp. GXIMD14793]
MIIWSATPTKYLFWRPLQIHILAIIVIFLSYGWDAQDQLVSVGSSEGWSLSFAYDAQQRRVGKTYTATDGTITTQVFVYDGPNVLFVFTTSGGVTKARRWMNAYGLDKRYGFEDYPSATPTPGTGTVYEVHQDYLGSVVAVVDPTTGTQVSRYRYDSFGQRTVISESVKPGYGFTGQQFDEETGLGYFRARYYDPKEGRFLSTDPLGFPDGPLNGYNYVAATPYQNNDPLGLVGTTAFVQHSRDKVTNDIYASTIAGAATGLLLEQFNEVFLFLESLGGLQGNMGADITVGGSTGGGDSERISFLIRLNSGCKPLNMPGPVQNITLDDSKRNHGGPTHNAIVAWRVASLVRNRAERLRKIGSLSMIPVVNRNQMNAKRQTVSNCKPDIQYDWAGGTMQHLEEISVSSLIFREFAKGIVMLQADPNAGWVLIRRYKRP